MLEPGPVLLSLIGISAKWQAEMLSANLPEEEEEKVTTFQPHQAD